jgi:hypothetical protein
VYWDRNHSNDVIGREVRSRLDLQVGQDSR